MDLTQLANLGEFIGGVAVLVTLVYLAVQIRQNASWSQRQALDSVVDRCTTWAARVRDNSEIFDLYVRGAEGFALFNDAEKQRYHLTKIEIMAALETILEYEKTRAIKEESANAARRWVVQQISGDGARTWWEEMGREAHSDDFVDIVDALVRNSGRPK